MPVLVTLGAMGLWGINLDVGTIMVGAISGLTPGWVYVYERDLGGADNWGELTRLEASDGVVDDRFGRSISIWEDTVVITMDVTDSVTVWETLRRTCDEPKIMNFVWWSTSQNRHRVERSAVA